MKQDNTNYLYQRNLPRKCMLDSLIDDPKILQIVKQLSQIRIVTNGCGLSVSQVPEIPSQKLEERMIGLRSIGLRITRIQDKMNFKTELITFLATYPRLEVFYFVADMLLRLGFIVEAQEKFAIIINWGRTQEGEIGNHALVKQMLIDCSYKWDGIEKSLRTGERFETRSCVHNILYNSFL